MIRLLTACVLAFFLASPAWAQGAGPLEAQIEQARQTSGDVVCDNERIHDYDVFIEVQENSDLIVTEVIKVCAMGQNIRRGIYRDFPYVNVGPDNARYRAGFKILKALKNGERENHFVETGNGIKRIFFGHPDRFLVPAQVYTYTLSYKTTRQIHYFEDHDELYWDVTGNEWAFPIDAARVTVHLPDGADISDYSAYTGRYGQTGQDWRYEAVTDNLFLFETTRPLNAGEGLTISLSWQKGLVQPLSRMEAWAIWLSGAGAPLAILLTLLAAFAYYLFAWTARGIDPPRGPVIPLFEPPEGLRPAAAAHIYYRDLGTSAGKSAMIATLVDLARRGFFEMKVEKKKATFINKAKSRDGLKPYESALLSGLFTRGASAGRKRTLGDKYSSTFRSGYVDFGTKLRRNYGSKYLVSNFWWCVLGVIISAVGVGMYFYLTRSLLSGSQVAQMSMLIGVSFAVFALGGLVEPVFRKIGLPVALFRALAVGLFVLIYILLLPGGRPTGWELPLLGGLLVLNLVFFELMRRPTPVGAKIATEIAGFKMYLATAESPKFNLAKAPQMSTSLFEEYLPWAIALGVEKPWSRYFKKTLPTEAANHSSSWVRGDSIGGDWAKTSSALTSSLSSATGSAIQAPASSSGGGGGGFSGGGGGGGGGGGW